MPAGSIEKTTCYGKAANDSQPFSHPEDAGGPRAARVSRTAGPCGASAGPGTAGFETPRNPRLRFAEVCGPRADGDAFAASGGHVVSGRKKAPQFGCGAFLQAYCETHGLRSISSMPFRVPAPRSIVRQKSRSSSRTVPFRRRSRIVLINCSANAGASISGSRSCSWRQVSR